jgi:hypothetical protein
VNCTKSAQKSRSEKSLFPVDPRTNLKESGISMSSSGKYGNADEPRWLKRKLPETSPLSWA